MSIIAYSEGEIQGGTIMGKVSKSINYREVCFLNKLRKLSIDKQDELLEIMDIYSNTTKKRQGELIQRVETYLKIVGIKEDDLVKMINYPAFQVKKFLDGSIYSIEIEMALEKFLDENDMKKIKGIYHARVKSQKTDIRKYDNVIVVNFK